jgi:hypothetical protein
MGHLLSYNSVYGVMLFLNLFKPLVAMLIIVCCLRGSMPFWLSMIFGTFAIVVMLCSFSFFVVLVKDASLVANTVRAHVNHPGNSPLYCCIFYNVIPECANKGPCVDINLTTTNIPHEWLNEEEIENQWVATIVKRHLFLHPTFLLTIILVPIIWLLEIIICFTFLTILKEIDSGQNKRSIASGIPVTLKTIKRREPYPMKPPHYITRLPTSSSEGNKTPNDDGDVEDEDTDDKTKAIGGRLKRGARNMIDTNPNNPIAGDRSRRRRMFDFAKTMVFSGTHACYSMCVKLKTFIKEVFVNTSYDQQQQQQKPLHQPPQQSQPQPINNYTFHQKNKTLSGQSPYPPPPTIKITTSTNSTANYQIPRHQQHTRQYATANQVSKGAQLRTRVQSPLSSHQKQSYSEYDSKFNDGLL